MHKRLTQIQFEISTHARLGALCIFLLAVVIGIMRLLSVPAPIMVPVEPVVPGATSAKEITHGNTLLKQVIFTFDGGDRADSARKILEVLAKHHIKGTFFLTGKFVEANTDLVREMFLEGHEIFNHTYSHPHLTTVSDEEVTRQLRAMAATLKNVAGVSPKPYFRAPYGDRDSRVIQDAFSAGYESVYWTVDARDWEESTGETAAMVEDRIMSDVAPGNIYLMHLGDSISGTILDRVFTKIEGEGYAIVPLSQGLR